MREFFKVPSLTQDLLELSLRGSVNLKKEMESREEEWRSWVWCKVRASLVEISIKLQVCLEESRSDLC